MENAIIYLPTNSGNGLAGITNDEVTLSDSFSSRGVVTTLLYCQTGSIEFTQFIDVRCLIRSINFEDQAESVELIRNWVGNVTVS